MVVFISLEARQKPFIVVCSYVIGIQFADKFNATGFGSVAAAGSGFGQFSAFGGAGKDGAEGHI